MEEISAPQSLPGLPVCFGDVQEDGLDGPMAQAEHWPRLLDPRCAAPSPASDQ